MRFTIPWHWNPCLPKPLNLKWKIEINNGKDWIWIYLCGAISGSNKSQTLSVWSFFDWNSFKSSMKVRNFFLIFFLRSSQVLSSSFERTTDRDEKLLLQGRGLSCFSWEFSILGSAKNVFNLIFFQPFLSAFSASIKALAGSRSWKCTSVSSFYHNIKEGLMENIWCWAADRSWMSPLSEGGERIFRNLFFITFHVNINNSFKTPSEAIYLRSPWIF